jgi:putative Ca2+/H+ antiporter (TMEM165/GDT1 family)
MSYLVILFTIFFSELGDKSQLANLLFASNDKYNSWMVFFMASLALILATAISVLVGTYAREYLATVPLKLISGVGFILIGCWSIYEHYHHVSA